MGFYSLTVLIFKAFCGLLKKFEATGGMLMLYLER